MTMASLSASLLTRHTDRRQRERGNEIFAPRKAVRLPTPEVRPSPSEAQPLGQKPAPLRPHKARAASKASAPTRKQKTLRLDRETDRALRMLAARDGVTQQSLMDAAVKALIREKSAETGCICGLRNR